jgi:hypothetical protein
MGGLVPESASELLLLGLVAAGGLSTTSSSTLKGVGCQVVDSTRRQRAITTSQCAGPQPSSAAACETPEAPATGPEAFGSAPALRALFVLLLLPAVLLLWCAPVLLLPLLSTLLLLPLLLPLPVAVVRPGA